MHTTTFSSNTILLTLFFLLIGLLMSAQDKSLVVIDKDYTNKESLMASVPISVSILQVDPNDNIWAEIYSHLLEDTEINDIHLFLKTTSNNFEIGNTQMGIDELQNSSELQNIGTIDKQRNLFVYSCSLANNNQGVQLLETLGLKTSFNVLSSKSCLSISDGNFNFDFSSKNQLIDTNLILD